jgi:hypothetical protein
VTPAAFQDFLPVAAVIYVLGLVLVEQKTFAEVARRGAVGARRNVRDMIMESLGRGALRGAALALLAAAIWGAFSWSRLGWEVMTGAEIFLAFTVLQIGIASLSVRMALRLVGTMEPGAARRPILLLRLAMLATGVLYAFAVWRLAPGGAGETLFAVFLLGAALFVVGLNRTGELPSERMVRLAEALRGIWGG